jgi:uncharacterized membrane protein
MKRNRLSLLLGSCVLGILTVGTSYIWVPLIVRIVLGVLIVFVVTGFALVSAVFPESQFSIGEHLLASIGMSLAMATATAVALGAAPIGLSRQSFAVVLGSCTLVLSICAVLRERGGNYLRGNSEDASTGSEP